MNKSEIVKHIVATTELSEEQAKRFINALLDIVIKKLATNEDVSLAGFGTFMTRESASKTGRNPSSGELINVTTRKIPAFKSGKSLKDAIKNNTTTTSSRDDRTDLKKSSKRLLKQEKNDLTKKERPSSENKSKNFTKQKSKNKNYAVVNIFFATDRKKSKSINDKLIFGSGRGRLSYGVTEVSIPRDHRMGEMESPSILRFELRGDPERHITLLNVLGYKKASYYEEISNRVKKSKKKSAFIFIHGYNVTFENAARRTAQMTYDLGFDGATVFYSWPSHGGIPKYPGDEENIRWSQKHIEFFIEDFSKKSKAESIYLIAHSMGNRALTEAVISVTKKAPKLKSKFSEIILAAPDIDSDIFKRDIAPAMLQIGAPITLYASSKDKALKASKAFHGGYPRAGDSGKNLLIIQGIESIDSTNVKTGFLGHSYYADERSIISDMFYILNSGLRANQRSCLNEITNRMGTYWEFKK